jgi:HK97 family phage major capsid protein
VNRPLSVAFPPAGTRPIPQRQAQHGDLDPGAAATLTPEQARTQIVEVRTALIAQANRLNELSTAPADKREDKWADEIRSARDEVMALDARYTALDRIAAPEPTAPGAGPVAANRQVGSDRDFRTAGQQFVESDGYKAAIERAGTRNGGSVWPGGNVSEEVRTLITGPGDLTAGGYGTEGGAFIPIMPFAIAPQAVRRDRLVVRDLLPQTTTSYPVIHYIEETYVSGSDAAWVAEGTLKPEGVMNWAAKQSLAQKVAVFIPATQESLTDGPQLRSAIDNRLAYKLRRAEESALLSGNGTPPNLLGLLNATNLQTQAKVTDTFTTITLGVALIEGHDGDPSGLVMNPTDYWKQIAASASTLTGASPFQGPPGTLWGYPVVRTPRMALGTALLGDFNQGAEIFDRETMTVRVGDQHSDFFIRNQVAILAEQREALVIYRGDLFCTLTGL